MKNCPAKLIRALIYCLLGFYLAGGATAARAADAEFDYDIFLANDTIVVWLDVLPALDQAKMEDLLAGLDLSLVFDLKIERPRRLLFSKTIASTRAALVISHPLTEDVYRLRLVNFGVSDREFKSQLELSDFLADSLVLQLAPKSQIIASPEVRLNLSLTVKSHSSNVLRDFTSRPADSLGAGSGEEEFFESVFSFFLNLIGFGKTSYNIVSPPFSPEELTSL